MGFVQRQLVKLVIRVVSYPKLTLAICVALLVGSVVLALTRLNLSTDEDELMTPKLAFFKDYKEFSREFPENDTFVIILEPVDPVHPPPARRWADLADQLAAGLGGLKEVTRVDTHVPPEDMGRQGLMFDEWENLRSESEHAAEVAQLGRIVGDPKSLEGLGTGGLFGQGMAHRVLNAMDQSPDVEDGAPLAEETMKTLAAALRSPRHFEQWRPGVEVARMAMADPRAKSNPRNLGYNMVRDESLKYADPQAYKTRQILVINIHTNEDYSSLAEVTEPLNQMREVVAKIAPKFTDFKYPVVTGRPALQADQMQTSDSQTRVAEICGLTLVFVALLFFLRNLWMVIVAELCLGTGIGWTFGWATLMVGRLNLLSLVFVIALIGIGMDYLIQILMRYRFEKKRYGRPQAIWARVFRYVSPPISTACAGASAAFFVALLTNFHGAAELGLIAGGGLLLCLATGYTLMPALLTVFPAHVGKVHESRRYPHREQHAHAGGWRFLPAVLWVLASLAGLTLALPPHFDPNLIKLQDESLPSVQEVHKLKAWSATILSTDLTKLRAAREAMLAQSPDMLALAPDGKTLIESTESVLNGQDKRDWLLKNNADKIKVNWTDQPPPTMADLAATAEAAEKLAAKWAAPKPGQKVLDTSSVAVAARALADAVHDKTISDAQKMARAGEWQRRFLIEVRNNVEQFAPPPLDMAKLPPSLKEHLIGPGPPMFAGTGLDGQGAYALVGYPEDPAGMIKVRVGDALAWDKSQVKAIEPADPGFDRAKPGFLTLRDGSGAGDRRIKLGRDLYGHLPAVVYAPYIYPKEDLWDASKLQPFVKEVEDRFAAYKQKQGEAASGVMLTGIAPQLVHSTAEIQGAFVWSTAYALIAIFVLMLLDLRSLGQTLLAISVLALGLPMLLFLMYVWHEWLGDPFGVPGSWNLANFFALPILIGAGHEYGVFMVHRYREAKHDPRRVWRTWDVADRSLLLCGIVTTCSFGFLTVSGLLTGKGTHHGLQSLGWVMAVGTASVYLSSLLVLRPILLWRLKQKKVYAENEEV